MRARVDIAYRILSSRRQKDIVHRAFTASSFSVKEERVGYLSNLAIASDGHFSEFIAGTQCTRIPLRWSAPESILYDKYSKESDVYMVGQLLYELFTHGCHPYTELYGHSLDRVLELRAEMAEVASPSSSQRDNSPQSTSAYDSSKQFDVCILTCDDAHCNKSPRTLLSSACKRDSLKTSLFELGVTDFDRLEEQLPASLVFALIVCYHNKKNFKQLWRRLKVHSVVVLGSIGRIESLDTAHYCSMIETEKNMNEFCNKISSEVQENRVYDGCWVGNDYTPGIVDGRTPSEMAMETTEKEYSASKLYSEKHAPTFSTDNSVDMKSPGFENTYDNENTDVKSFGYELCETTNLKEISEDNEVYSSLSDAVKDDVFLETKTLQPSRSHTGSFVSQDYILPMLKYEDLEHKVPAGIVLIYNRGSCKDIVDLEKYITINVMKKCVDCNNFHGLVTLLSCHKRSIQMNAFQNIEKMLYKMKVRLCNTQDLLYGITDLLSLVELWSGDQELLILLLNTALTTFIILFMSFNARMDDSIKNKIRDVCRNAKEKMNKVEHLHITDEILKSAFENIRKSAYCFCHHLETVSVLRMGNWSDAMKKDNNREKIIKEFPEMSELEQSTVIFGLLNQVLLQTGGHHTTLFTVLQTCLKGKLNVKKKENISMFPMLQLTTKMVKMILDTTICQAKEALTVLSLYMDSAKVHQAVRKFLMKEIDGLLFHKDKSIVSEVFYFLSKNKMHLHFDLRQTTVSHIEKSLHPLNITIDKDSYVISGNTPLPPHWNTFKGTFDDYNVNVHILLPSKNCVMKGVMEDYRENLALKEILKEHEQQRDMLHLLCSGGMTPLVLPLVAFQCRPLPPFYITIQDRNHIPMLEYLLSKRKEKDWIPFEKLFTMAADILNAVKFLHSRDIVHRALTASCFSVRENGSVYLSNLATASDGHFSEFIAECTRIPLRWSAPESILYDKYSKESDVYMVGQLLYELFTHGCHPYTELYGYSLDYVLELIVFQNLKPMQWPCIPKDIHEIILLFINSDPLGRESLDKGIQKLNNILLKLSSNRASTKRLSHSHKEDQRYPKIDLSLPIEPQTETPVLFKRLKNQNGKIDPFVSYTNLRKSKRKPKTILAISEADITSSDAPSILKKDLKLIVQEPISPKFYEMYFTDLSQSALQEILNILKWPPAIEKNPWILHFTCFSGESLSQLSLRRCFGDPDDQENNIKYSWLVHYAVKFINELHGNGWILRDICCQNLHFDSDNQKVFSTRLGRVAYISPEEVLDDSVIDEVFSDRRNWSPLEVLQYGQYSREGDVYMLAMAIYEFYMGLEINLESPASSFMKCVPFCRVPKKELIEHLLSGEVPQQPMYCPAELYEIMGRCWNRDRTRRPTCAEFLQVTSRLVYIQDEDSIGNIPEEVYSTLPHDPPELPPRRFDSVHMYSTTNPAPCIQQTDTKNEYSSYNYQPSLENQMNPRGQVKVNPLYGFDRMDSKRSNFRRSTMKGTVRKSKPFDQSRNWSLRKSPTEEQECQSTDTFSNTNSGLNSGFSVANMSSCNSDNSSMISDSTFSIANSSLDSSFSVANPSSSNSDADSQTYQDCFSVTTDRLNEMSRHLEAEAVTLDLSSGNDRNNSTERAANDYIELVENQKDQDISVKPLNSLFEGVEQGDDSYLTVT